MLAARTAQSFFLFGPRGTGKTAWLHAAVPDALFFDLLDEALFLRLHAAPERLGDQIPAAFDGWIVVDEIQRSPALLNEIHRLIEARGLRFALTGSSARKLRSRGTNLLGGRAVVRRMHPLTAAELGADFDIKRALRNGLLPIACTRPGPQRFLASYVASYLREEVHQEGLVRNLGGFSRFLEAASFSQGSTLNVAAVARDCAVSAKVTEDYFTLLDDLLIAVRIPVFTRRARRKTVAHPKFYFFDAGVYRAIRPRGPLDSDDEIGCAALETLVLQHLRAHNDYAELGYDIRYWRTSAADEVDFVLYGPRGLHAIEVKRSDRIRDEDTASLRLFGDDYPEARKWLLYAGTRRQHDRGVEIVPLAEALPALGAMLA